MSEPINERPFRFAGVELGPGDKVQDKLRGLARGDLLKNSIRSILIGTVFALLLLYAEKFLRDPDIEYLSPLPDPYPYVSHGLPWFLIFFYIGWALYWGVFDCLNAEIMDEEHGANRVIGRLGNFTGRALPWMSVMAGSAPVGLAAYGIIALQVCIIVLYSLFGGGVYAFYKLLRQSREPAT
ncbi:MAG: hypothetical protein ACLP59_20670 [Bryobacteraceae bacterium]